MATKTFAIEKLQADGWVLWGRSDSLESAIAAIETVLANEKKYIVKSRYRIVERTDRVVFLSEVHSVK